MPLRTLVLLAALPAATLGQPSGSSDKVEAGHSGQPPGHGIEVIGAGLSRTSTQSLVMALNSLGFKAMHAEGFHPKMTIGGWDLFFAVAEAGKSYVKDRNGAVLDKPLQMIEDLHVNALVDIPWSECVLDLLKRNPNAKVVVTIRDNAEVWYKSYWRHFRWASVIPPVLPIGFVDYWRRIAESNGCGFVTAFPPWFPSEEQVRGCMGAHSRHVEHLQENVQEGNLLVFNPKQGWAPLCEFLAVQVPNVTFPQHDAFVSMHWPAGVSAFLAVVYGFYVIVALSCTCCMAMALRCRRRRTLHQKES